MVLLLATTAIALQVAAGVSPAREAAQPLLVPGYLAPGAQIPELLATLAATGLANRQKPNVWLNSSATSWRNGVPVMWSYPQADTIWLQYLNETKGLHFDVAQDAELCTLLAHPSVAAAVQGRVMYDASRGAGDLNALQYAAVSAAGIHSGVPVTTAMLAKHSCLAKLPVLRVIPAASTFTDDLAVYAWMAKTLMPLASTKVLVGACDNWANYTCGWGDPLGTASIDFAVSKKSMVINLSPDTSKHPEQAAMFSVFAAHMGPLGAFSGWAEPESLMVSLLSKKDGVVVCGAPNLSFLSALEVTTSKLPHHRSPTATELNRSKIYLSFQSNEGDTPKNAYSFRGGNWLLDSRGSVPIAWGSAPVIAELFPGLWEYYAITAKAGDQFFGATGGAGYTHPWSLPDPTSYFDRVASLNSKYMPDDMWEDVWDGQCPTGQPGAGENPCLPMYSSFEKAAHIGGFSQWCSSCNHTADPHYVYNNWLADGTPIFGQASSMWYPSSKGFCNRTDGGHGKRPSPASLAAEADCIEKHLRAIAVANPQRPLFVPAYGIDNYLDIAMEMRTRLGSSWEVIGAQDMAVLGRQAAPKRLGTTTSKP